MSRGRDSQNDSQPKQRIPPHLLHVGINILATGILFWFTVHDDEPSIAHYTELSMVLRWAVIATVVAFLQFCWHRGWNSKSNKG